MVGLSIGNIMKFRKFYYNWGEATTFNFLWWLVIKAAKHLDTKGDLSKEDWAVIKVLKQGFSLEYCRSIKNSPGYLSINLQNLLDRVVIYTNPDMPAGPLKFVQAVFTFCHIVDIAKPLTFRNRYATMEKLIDEYLWKTLWES